MNTSRLSAGASRFAHFAGLSRRSRAAEDDHDEDEPKGKKSKAADGDEDEDEPKGKRSKASDDDGDEPKGKKSKAADGDEDEDEPKGKKSKASDDDEDEDEPKGKKSKASDGDDEEDDDKDEMHGRSAKASARLREQERIAAILGNKAAANNLPLAISLACETRMTRQEALAVLRGQAGRSQRDDDDDRDDRRSRHAREDRSSRNVNLNGGGADVTGPQAVAKGWEAAFTKAGIKPR